MKKALLIGIMALFAIQAHSEERTFVDMAAVRKAVEDTAYYNNLEREFFNFKKLSPENIVNLYYGQAFQEDYSPYDKLIWQDKIDKIMEEHGAKTALAICVRLLEERPAYLPLIEYTINMMDMAETDKKLKLALIMNKVHILVAIAKAAEGTMESPFIVTSVSDEYLLMSVMRLKSKKQALIEDDGHYYDMHEVEPNDNYKSDKIYFDIDLPYTRLEEKGLL